MEGNKLNVNYYTRGKVIANSPTHYQDNQSQSQRIDFIWNQYFDNSIKNVTREIQAAGHTHSKATKRIEQTTPLPKKWGQFLKNIHNKVEFFKFLNKHLSNAKPVNQTYV